MPPACAGLVGITGACAVVEPYGALVIGLVSGMVYMGASKLLHRLQIDDPLDTAPVHLFCGVWGVIASGFFATESGVERAYRNNADWGVFYGGSGDQLGVQLLGEAQGAGAGWLAGWLWGLLACVAMALQQRVGRGGAQRPGAWLSKLTPATQCA